MLGVLVDLVEMIHELVTELAIVLDPDQQYHEAKRRGAAQPALHPDPTPPQKDDHFSLGAHCA